MSLILAYTFKLIIKIFAFVTLDFQNILLQYSRI
jgi:hypothetical protein